MGRAAAMMREDTAQATVEMAVAAPVLIVLALIVYNLMTFAAAAARFDRVVPDIVLAHGASPVSGEAGSSVTDASAAVSAQVERAMEGYAVEIEVACEQTGGQGAGGLLSLTGGLRTYRCTMRYRPWPSGLSIAGVEMGAPAFLSHERAVTIDPWRSGVVA